MQLDFEIIMLSLSADKAFLSIVMVQSSTISRSTHSKFVWNRNDFSNSTFHKPQSTVIGKSVAQFHSISGPFSIYEQPKYKPNLTLTLILIQTLILTQILTLKPTWVDATTRSHFGCSYIEKEPNILVYLIVTICIQFKVGMCQGCLSRNPYIRI